MKISEAIKIIRETKEGFPKHLPTQISEKEFACYYCGEKVCFHQKKCNYCYTEIDWGNHERNGNS